MDNKLEEKRADNPIKKYRTERNMTAQDLAIKCQVTVAALSRWETGTQRPSIANMAKLMAITGNVNLGGEYTKWHEELRNIMAESAA